MIIRIIASFVVYSLSLSLIGQTRILSGRIADDLSGNPLPGAHISIYLPGESHPARQTISGNDGSFILTCLPADTVRVLVSYIGHKLYTADLSLKDEEIAGFKILLENSPVPVGEITINALRQDMKLKDVSLPVTVVTEAQIEKQAGITVPDMLKYEPGIEIARDGIWATSLNIRGLTEQRILVLVDGNRIETATDIAAGLAMIDLNDIKRMEVIKGPASSLYGTGAMGGVVNIISKNGYYNNGFYSGGSISGTYMTVNRMHSENISVNLGDSLWYIYGGATYRKALNTNTPEGELSNSQFTDQNITFRAGIKPFRDHELKLNYQRFYASDVGIPGGSAFPSSAVATYPAEMREMFSAGYMIKNPTKKIGEIEFKFFHQYILRDVKLIPGPSVTITPSGFHNTNGLLMQVNRRMSKNNVLIAGLDIWQRQLKTEREKTVIQAVKDSSGNVVSTKKTVRGEMPIPSSSFTSTGIFFQDQADLFDDKFKFTFGGRLDLIHVINDMAVDPLYIISNDIRNENPPNQRITFEAGQTNNISWSAEISLLYHLFNDVDLTLTASKSFRSPSLEERFKYIDLGSTVKIGDPNLLPEDGYFLDAGARIWKDRFHFAGNVFLNSMSNLIAELPGTVYYNYSDQPERTDTIPALINSNIARALLYGFDATANYNFFDGLTLICTASFVRGKDMENDSDLPQIPPLNGRVGIRYNIREIMGIELYSNLVADQDKIGKGETTTGGYASYDLGIISVPINSGFARIVLAGGIQNISNRAYMNHLSTNRGIIKYEPGRNFYIRAKLEF